jgi:hypothetical protein
MPLQATRNPEHLSMSRDSNCTKQILIREGKSHRQGSTCEMCRDDCVNRIGGFGDDFKGDRISASISDKRMEIST